MTNFRSGSFQELPVVVKNLIIINVIMVVLQYTLGTRGIILADYLGLHYWSSPLFRWWQPFTHMFMHGDALDVEATLLHIVSNMFALWMFGRILENMWGPQKFLIFYLICGLGAAICHTGVLTWEFSRFHAAFMQFQQNPTFDQFAAFVKSQNFSVNPQFMKAWALDDQCNYCTTEAIRGINDRYLGMINEATVGASGAVMGVLFAFGYLFPNAELMLIFPPIPVKAKYFVGFYALFELYAGIKNSAGDNIAHFAHLGGMLFAFILLRVWIDNRRRHF